MMPRTILLIMCRTVIKNTFIFLCQLIEYDVFFLQMHSTLRTRVAVRQSQLNIVNHDLTPVIGQFNPNLLCYLTGLKQVFLMRTNEVEAMPLVEALPFLRNLQVLVLDKCANFHESHVVKIAENNPSLQYLEVYEGTKLSFEVVHFILGSMHNLRFFAFDPKYPEMVDEWRRILRIFQYKGTQFGGDIVKILRKE